MRGFEKRPSSTIQEKLSFSSLSFTNELDTELKNKLYSIIEAWNFYCGYHWEGLEDLDGPQVTVNYCRPFVNKFVSFELGKSFTMNFSRLLEKVPVTKDKRTLFEYMEDLWIDNKQYALGIKMGLMKSITGEAWFQVVYQDPEDEDFHDPYGIYREGRIRLILQPTTAIFPEYDPHDSERLIKLTLMYEYTDTEVSQFLRKEKEVKRTFKRVWTSDTIVTIDGNEDEEVEENKYGVIPFVRVVNLTVPFENRGVNDLDDLIPMNSEYNLKKSDVSEIIDYHASPITLVYGAKIGNLEKGANKVWGGLPVNSKVENLESLGDLSASQNYIKDLKVEMCEVAGVPETVLGGAQAISNTSGVALQYINLPLIEKTRVKRKNTEDGLEDLNRMIIHISLLEDLIRFPNVVEITERDTEGVEQLVEKPLTVRDMFFNEVTIPDTLPKDDLIEMQLLQQEMSSGLESRRGALKRLGREGIEDKLNEVDEDRMLHPEHYTEFDGNMVNSGMMNGQGQKEEVTKELTGANGGAQE